MEDNKNVTGANSDFTTGRTDRVNTPEKTTGNNPAETEKVQQKSADETGSHREGQYDHQSDKPGMDPEIEGLQGMND